MPSFTAQDVKKLRDATGAGMMDAKKALTENDGDFDAGAKWLRERGLGKAAERSDRENTQGAVGIAVRDGVAAMVELRCETDFVAKSPDFVNLVNDLADLAAAKGEDAVKDKQAAIDDLKVTLKENIDLGRVYRFEAAPGNVVDTYLHVQNDRGVNGVLVELAGGTKEIAHDVAVHAAMAKPTYLSRDEVPAEEVASEREMLLAATKKDPKQADKPDAALEKVVEGKLNGWYGRWADKGVTGGVLLEQKFVKDEKQTVSKMLGDAKVVRFAQIVIGG